VIENQTDEDVHQARLRIPFVLRPSDSDQCHYCRPTEFLNLEEVIQESIWIGTMPKRGSQLHKGNLNLRPVASVTHGRLCNAGSLEAKVAIITTFLHSATKKRIFFENENKDRLKRSFLGE
jgi:hypothetical protein